MFLPVSSDARTRAALRLVFGLLIACVPALAAATTYTVNSTADVNDADPSDGICRTASNNTVCTLRGAIMSANFQPGPDTIVLQPNTTYLLSRVGVEDDGLDGDLDVYDSVTITGAGPGSTIIDGNGAATGDRVMAIFQCLGRATPVMGSCPGGAPAVVVSISGVAFRHGQPMGATVGGAGIFNAGQLTLDNCAITDNSTDRSAGGIFNFGTLVLSNCTVANNVIGGNENSGGGIYSDGSLTIIDSTIRDNTITNPSAFPYGGGVYQFTKTVTITGTTISGNHAGLGGGVYAENTTLNVVNSTISGNFSRGNGGGILVDHGTAGLYNVTIASNEANDDASGGGTGGGVYNDTATVTLNDSILTGGFHRNDGSIFTTLDDCSGTFTSQGSNIVTNAAGCTVNPPASAVSAGLGVLQNNGGPTQTHALLPGSNAIDAGNIGGCTDDLGAPITIDQRGEPRNDGACDLGAFERGEGIFKDGFET